MSTPCVDVQGDIPLYVGGELESPAREELERHLTKCPACRKSLERASEARTALREHLATPGIEASRPTLWPGIRARLVEAGLIAPPATSAPPGRPTGRLLRIAPVAAAAAALFALGTLTGRLGMLGEEGPPAALEGPRDPGTAGEPGGALADGSAGSETPAARKRGSLTPVGAGDAGIGEDALPWEILSGEIVPDYFTDPFRGNQAAGFQPAPRRDGVR